MKIITESEMKFGKFDEKNLFHIEESQIYVIEQKKYFWILFRHLIRNIIVIFAGIILM